MFIFTIVQYRYKLTKNEFRAYKMETTLSQKTTKPVADKVNTVLYSVQCTLYCTVLYVLHTGVCAP